MRPLSRDDEKLALECMTGRKNRAEINLAYQKPYNSMVGSSRVARAFRQFVARNPELEVELIKLLNKVR